MTQHTHLNPCTKENFCRELSEHPLFEHATWTTYLGRAITHGSEMTRGDNFGFWLRVHDRQEFNRLFREWVQSHDREAAK